MSKLKFPHLQSLVPDMEQKGIDKEHFVFTYSKRTIDCVFCICHINYELLVGVHSINFGFAVNIKRNRMGEYVAEITDEDYIRFCRALNLTYRGDGFTSNTLLCLLSEHIPTKSTGVRIDHAEMRNYVKCRHVDEADKRYFKGWNDHIKDGRQAQNFDKTEFYLGREVADYCRRNNISSLWTNIQREEERYSNPWN